MTAMLANGTRFGKLVVLKPASSTTNGNARSRCRCDCGAEVVTRIAWLKSGRTSACRKCSEANS